MNDLQSAITRLRAADDQHPDFWVTIRDRDADPQMVLDVVAVARAYARKQTVVQQALRIIHTWALCDDSNKIMRSVAMTDIAHKAAEGLGE